MSAEAAGAQQTCSRPSGRSLPAAPPPPFHKAAVAVRTCPASGPGGLALHRGREIIMLTPPDAHGRVRGRDVAASAGRERVEGEFLHKHVLLVPPGMTPAEVLAQFRRAEGKDAEDSSARHAKDGGHARKGATSSAGRQRAPSDEGPGDSASGAGGSRRARQEKHWRKHRDEKKEEGERTGRKDGAKEGAEELKRAHGKGKERERGREKEKEKERGKEKARGGMKTRKEKEEKKEEDKKKKGRHSAGGEKGRKERRPETVQERSAGHKTAAVTKHAHHTSPPPPPPPPPPLPPLPPVLAGRPAVCRRKYNAQKPSQLSLRFGEHIFVDKIKEHGFVKAHLPNGASGHCPLLCLRILAAGETLHAVRAEVIREREEAHARHAAEARAERRAACKREEAARLWERQRRAQAGRPLPPPPPPQPPQPPPPPAAAESADQQENKAGREEGRGAPYCAPDPKQADTHHAADSGTAPEAAAMQEAPSAPPIEPPRGPYGAGGGAGGAGPPRALPRKALPPAPPPPAPRPPPAPAQQPQEAAVWLEAPTTRDADATPSHQHAENQHGGVDDVTVADSGTAAEADAVQEALSVPVTEPSQVSGTGGARGAEPPSDLPQKVLPPPPPPPPPRTPAPHAQKDGEATNLDERRER